jgi:hypothetical protein
MLYRRKGYRKAVLWILIGLVLLSFVALDLLLALRA